MNHSTGTLTAADGTALFTRRWTPDRGAKGSVVLVHGVHEHSGRHAYAAATLMARGLEVFSYDHRGHGRSGGARADVQAFDAYVADLDVVLAEVHRETGGRPVVLMGHSMGGLVAAAYVVEKGADGLAGLVLSSPALHTFPVPRLLERAAPHVARWLPLRPISRLDLSRLSHDPAVEREYREDALNTISGLRARLAYHLLLGSRRVQAHPEAFTLPLYLMHGTGDTITPHGGSEWLAEHAPSPDVTLRLYDGLYHELMKEPERDAILRDLADWVEAHVAA